MIGLLLMRVGIRIATVVIVVKMIQFLERSANFATPVLKLSQRVKKKGGAEAIFKIKIFTLDKNQSFL